MGARIRGGGAALRVVAELAKAVGEEVPGVKAALRAVELAQEVAASKSEGAATDAESAAAVTLQQTKAAIAEVLAQRSRPLVVFVDEIDRLDAGEIRTLFRVIRANADLPNLVLVLFFHRTVVEAALDTPGAPGREYLEKMVQVGLDLPEPPRDTLPDLFASRTADAAAEVAVLGDDGRQTLRDQLFEWFHATLYEYVRTPRDIVRLENTFRFYLGGLVEDGTPTVSPLDLLLLDVLRTHEPEVYHALPRLKDELVGEYPMELFGKPSERRVRAVGDLLALAENEPATRDLLVALFPLTGAVVRDDVGALSSLRRHGPEWVRHRRAAHPDTFDRYFAFTRGALLGLQDRAEALAAEHDDTELVASRLADAVRRGEFWETLDRALAFADQIAAGDPARFLAGVFDAGDLAEAPPDVAHRVVLDVLDAVRRAGDPTEPILADALRLSNGLAYPVGVAQRAAQHPGPYGLLPSFVPTLDALALAVLRGHSTNGHLIQSHRLGYLLTRWHALGPPQQEGRASAAETWAKEIADGPYGIARLAEAFSQLDTLEVPGQPTRQFSWERLKPWLDLEMALGILDQQIDQVASADRSLIDAFRTQATAHLAKSAAPAGDAPAADGGDADRDTVDGSDDGLVP